MRLTVRQASNLTQLTYNLIEARCPPYDPPPHAAQVARPAGIEERERAEAEGLRGAIEALGIEHRPGVVREGFRRGAKTIEYPWPGRDVPEPDEAECVPSEAEARAVERLWDERVAGPVARHRRAGDLAAASVAASYGEGVRLALTSLGIAHGLTASRGGLTGLLRVADAGHDCRPDFMVLGRTGDEGEVA